jgi:O-antigen/teichoic acid export membrane protein
MSKLKTLAGETVLYGLGTILPRMLNFLLVPLHTYVFSREEYGAVTKLYALVGFINVVYMFGMETAFFRFATKPEYDAKRIFNLAQSIVVYISLPLTILLIAFAPQISIALGLGHHPEYIISLSIVMLMDALVAIPFARLRLEKKALPFSMAKIINVTIVLALTYYFLVVNYDPTIGIGFVFMVNVLANFFFVLFFIKTIISWRPAFDKQISGAMFQYAYPVMLTGAAGMTNEMFSRLTLDWWLPNHFYSNLSKEAALGIFGACYKYAVLMNLGIQAFRFAAEPFFFSQAADKNSPTLFAKVNHYFLITCCVFLLAVSINLDVLQYFIGENFREGLSIVPILLLAYLFLGIYYNFSVWFKLKDKTYYGTWITVGGAFITILANYILIPLVGFTGSAWAALLCYFSMTVACFMSGQKYYPIPYKVMQGLGYIVLTVLLVYGINLLEFDTQLMATLFHGLVIIIFVGSVYLLERKNLQQGN